jgi:hypothetical protein
LALFSATSQLALDCNVSDRWSDGDAVRHSLIQM